MGEGPGVRSGFGVGLFVFGLGFLWVWVNFCFWPTQYGVAVALTAKKPVLYAHGDG